MLHRAIQVRLYPTQKQQIQLAPALGCARWCSNYGLNKSIEFYKKTGKKLGCSELNTLLPDLKKSYRSAWLGECYSQVLQATTLKLTTAYKIIFHKLVGFPKFKMQPKKQSVQYRQNVKILEDSVTVGRNSGIAKPKISRLIEGKNKSVIIRKNYSKKSLASIILNEIECENQTTKEGRIYGIDLGVKHFAIVTEGEKKSKYDKAKHFGQHEKNLKRQPQKLRRQQTINNSWYKYRKVVAKLYEQFRNSRQYFLHKLSYKWVSDRLAVIVENFHFWNRSRNQNVAKARSDEVWESFTNFLAYKLERKGGNLVEIDRGVSSSKLCSNCFHQMTEMQLDMREGTCPHCATDRDREREKKAGIKIKAEGIKILKAEGSAVSALGCEVIPKQGRKSKLRHSPMSTEAPTIFGTTI
ncbi:transposase [Microcoleus vaginatus PCC 9802]|uniref:RNA-guided endonuclease InsQ/TnpB family protein n=1 Tax=Microcoleus vaginatus TaxID=119532 RepID=UPI00020D16D4|nr:transposase IS891/IS1136/IS1341 family [Microcoleus vaginatus FGP-2]UNU21375.1 transposase [Microcoleus vaginatus PCC 9802]